MRFVLAAAAAAIFASCFAAPGVTAKSAIVMDAESGVILFEKDARATRFPASTTKIMTALLLLEKTKPGEMLSATPECEEVTGSSLHLKVGEQVSREDALYALMLRSANDMAHCVAVHISGSDQAFARLMNARAKELGCVNTHFNNPHGLNDDLHTTCAYDLALIARAAMENDEFRKACATSKYFITRSVNQEDLLLKSHNKLLDYDPTYEGIKTGYTVPAGRCFVGARSINGWRIITVVLASQDWVADTKALSDWAFAQYQKRVALPAGVVGSAAIRGGVSAEVPGKIERDFSVILSRGEIERRPEIDLRELQAPIRAGEIIGFVKSVLPDGQIVEAPILAAVGVDALPPIISPRRGWLFYILLGGIFGSAVYIRKKRRGFKYGR